MIKREPTGILDKNGVEIHTGDILHDPSWWWGAGYVYLLRGTCGPCKGDSVFCYVLAVNIDDPVPGAVHNIWNGRDVTIIGNIYDTPELLGVTDKTLPAASKQSDWPEEIS